MHLNEPDPKPRSTWSAAAILTLAGLLILAGIGLLNGRSQIAEFFSDDMPRETRASYAALKASECIARGYPVPAGLDRQTYCESYGAVQAVCKYERKGGDLCEK